MFNKDILEAIAGLNETLRIAISDEVEKSGGEVELPDDCCYPAFDTYGDVKINYFEKVFNKDDNTFVKYHDDMGDYEAPICLFSIDELIEIYGGL